MLFTGANADDGPDPDVWVINAEDQPKARAMLREAGLIEDSKKGFGTADPATSYLPASALAPLSRKRDPRRMIVTRVRMVLLAIIAFLSMLIIGGVIRH